MTIQVSYFSLASLAALVVFLAVMAPRALLYLGHVILSALSGKTPSRDPWLLAIAVTLLLCAGLALAMAMLPNHAQTLLNNSESVTLSFLFFAAPAVLQVVRAWRNAHVKSNLALSHVLVVLAILSLPASMAVPTAALMQATVAQPAAPPTDNPAALFANERYFTDNEVANDPEDYPVAALLQTCCSLNHVIPPRPGTRGQNFYRQIPAFTAFWFDQTANILTFEATDTFGALVSRITYVRANWGFALAVFLYKLLCALVLVAVSFDNLLAPLAKRLSGLRAPKGKPGRKAIAPSKALVL